MAMRFRPADLSSRVFLADPTTHYDEIDWDNFDAVLDGYKRRIEQWYIAPTRLLAKEHNFGFAVLTMACLLIDTLSQYEAGAEESSRKIFKKFVRRRLKGFKKTIDPIGHVKDRADALWDGFRCGILHEAHLKLYCGVQPNAPDPIQVVEGQTELSDGTPCVTVVLDPMALFAQVEGAFHDLIADLRKKSNKKLRERFKRKFEASFGVKIRLPEDQVDEA